MGFYEEEEEWDFESVWWTGREEIVRVDLVEEFEDRPIE